MRADSGFGDESFLSAAESLGLKFIVVSRLTRPIQTLCRHADEQGEKTDVVGLEVQEVSSEAVGRRLILIRQQVTERPHAGGKLPLEVPGYRFQALATNLPSTIDLLAVWRRYNGRRYRKPHQRAWRTVRHQSPGR